MAIVTIGFGKQTSRLLCRVTFISVSMAHRFMCPSCQGWAADDKYWLMLAELFVSTCIFNDFSMVDAFWFTMMTLFGSPWCPLSYAQPQASTPDFLVSTHLVLFTSGY